MSPHEIARKCWALAQNWEPKLAGLARVAAPFWRKQGRRQHSHTSTWSFWGIKEHRLSDTEFLCQERHQNSMHSNQRAPATIPKKVGVNDGYLFKCKCTL